MTGAELFQSAGHWGLVAELSDPDRRGEYQGAARLGGTVGQVWAPAAYTFLAINWGTPGWLLIGGDRRGRGDRHAPGGPGGGALPARPTTGGGPRPPA